MVTIRTKVVELKQDSRGTSLVLGKIKGLNSAERSKLGSMAADCAEVEITVELAGVTKK